MYEKSCSKECPAQTGCSPKLSRVHDVNGTKLEHPSVDLLAAYGLGKLKDAEFAEIEAHIAGCAACCERLRELPGDKIVQLVRGCGG
jgi:hypothetical protein